LIGEIEEGDPITEMDKIFDQKLSYFANSAVFKQQIQILTPGLKSIIGDVAYQACDDKQCIFDQYDLGFSLDGSTVVINKEVDAKSLDLAENLEIPLTNTELLKGNQQSEGTSSNGLLNLFVLGFLGGLIALLTPCVFPMIPLTVSFFTKQSSNKRKGVSNAILYGVFIIGIYMALSVPFHFLDTIAPEILNNISTNVWLNIIFFIIFVVFAFSFFGYFELTLPHSWGNKMDSASGAGGIIGIFFMALTLAIVSFSCTGPILGS